MVIGSKQEILWLNSNPKRKSFTWNIEMKMKICIWKVWNKRRRWKHKKKKKWLIFWLSIYLCLYLISIFRMKTIHYNQIRFVLGDYFYFYWSDFRNVCIYLYIYIYMFELNMYMCNFIRTLKCKIRVFQIVSIFYLRLVRIIVKFSLRFKSHLTNIFYGSQNWWN